jgi:peroxiredoxin Q/BCP
LRQEHDLFLDRNAAVLVVGPDGPRAFKNYWQENDMPFPGLADLRSRVAERYYQEVNLFKFGRMPAIFVIDFDGNIRYAHYADSMSDLPPNQDLLDVIDAIHADNAMPADH